MADQKSQIDAHCGRQKQVIRTSLWEMETDRSVRIDPSDLRVYPIGSHWTINPYREWRRPMHGLLSDHQRASAADVDQCRSYSLPTTRHLELEA
jgi:hypothetical protein